MVFLMKNELICQIIRQYKCEHCALTYSNKTTWVWLLYFFQGLEGRWLSKILRNIWRWYVKILTIPYMGGWVVWKRPKTPLRNIKMAPKRKAESKVKSSKPKKEDSGNKYQFSLWCKYWQKGPCPIWPWNWRRFWWRNFND